MVSSAQNTESEAKDTASNAFGGDHYEWRTVDWPPL